MPERRKNDRVRLLKPVQAKVRTYSPAKVLDLSEGGLLLTLAHPLCPGDRHEVRLLVDGDEVVVHAVVRRCWLDRREVNPEGARVHVYSAGLEFLEVQPGLLQRLPEESIVHVRVEPEETP